jgi:hypothetical protein
MSMILFIIASIVIVVAIPTTRENGVMAFSCRPLPSLAALPLFNAIMIDHDPVHHPSTASQIEAKILRSCRKERV